MASDGRARDLQGNRLTNWQEISVSHPLYTHFPLLRSLSLLPPTFTAFVIWWLAASHGPERECIFHADWITLGNSSLSTPAVISDFSFRKLIFKNSGDDEERNRGLLNLCWVLLINDTISWIICPLWVFTELKISFLQVCLKVDNLNGQSLC